MHQPEPASAAGIAAGITAGAATPLPTPSGRKRPVHIPWRDIACRLAEGARPAAVAAALGLPEERIWRHLRNSLRFRFYLQQAMERQRLLAGLQLATLGQSALLARGLHAESLDGDVLRLLGEAAPAGNLAEQIEQLGKTCAPPPNMAFRRRLAEEKRQMDHQVAVWRIQDAARAAAGKASTPAVAAEPQRCDTKEGEAARSETNTREAARSDTNAREPLRSAANTGEAPRSAANAGEAAGSTGTPAEPGSPPRLRLRWSPPPKPRPSRQPSGQAWPRGAAGLPDS